VVAEKLLRSCPHVARIYLLVRKKKKVTPEQRFAELLTSSVFDQLRATRKDFVEFARSKFALVTGDLLLPRMGMSEGDWAKLTGSVEVILHNAATILFDEPLEEALRNNTMGALNVLGLAQECVHLACFVHCSTAYVNPTVVMPQLVREEVYATREVTDDPEGLLEELLATDPRLLQKNLRSILGAFPNTYTFTKNLTEQMLLRRRGKVPTCVVRPSIVACAWDGPQRGWIDNVNAAGSYFLLGSLGLLRYVWGKANNIGDLIPVDFVSNASIVAAMHCAHSPELNVYHVTSSHRNPLQWGRARDYMEAFTNNHPPPKAIAPCDLHFMEHGWTYYPSYWLNQKLPALLYMAYAHSPLGSATDRNNATQLSKIMEKSKKVAETFRFFVNTEWTYATTKLMKMFGTLSPEDRLEFNFDPATVDWDSFTRSMSWGLRYFVTDEKTLVHPDLERFSKMYFDRRSFQVTADLLWAYNRHPRGISPSAHAPQLIVDRTLHSDRVKNAIATLSAQHNVPVEKLRTEARQIMDQMAGQLYEPVIRTLAYFFRKVYKNLYDAIIVDELGLKRLRDIRSSVAGKAVPLLVIPTHRSYIDFLMMSFLFFSYELPMPQIAAGDDFLDMAGVNWIFRQSGAFFLKRSFRNDLLYRSIFEEYVQQLLIGGHTLEFFIEGTRSRTGKNLPPKVGLLNMATEPYFQGKVDDMHLLPVAIGYEKMVEEDNHARQLTGEPRGSFSTKKLLAATYDRVLGASFGRINIQFAEPIVLSQYVAECKAAAAASGGAALDPHTVTEHRLSVTRSLAHRVLYDFLKESVVMSTGIVAALVLAYRNGIDKETLVEKYSWVEQQVTMRGARVDPLSRSMDALSIVDRALRLLGRGVVVERRSFVEPLVDSRESHRNILQLGLYRNQLPHVFFGESLLLIALEAASEPVTGPESLFEGASFLKTLLSGEFDTGPCDWPALFGVMEQRGLVERDENNVVAVVQDGSQAANFFCSLVWPFVDAHWVAVLSLFSLQPHRSIGEELLVSQMQWFSEKLFFDRVILHFDACSKESMRYAVLVLVKHFGVLVRDDKDEKLSLAPAFQSEQAIASLADEIGRFRKAGNSGHAASKQVVLSYFGVHHRAAPVFRRSKL
jgi:1-acyl-sn-glycerol-3-phosphate acyltransferase/thioester reductase-like protein